MQRGGKQEDMTQLVDYYSWADIEKMGLQFVSANLSSVETVYEKYFYPMLFNSDGKYKSADALARDMRNINMAIYCATTNEIAKLSNLLEQDLKSSKQFSQEGKILPTFLKHVFPLFSYHLLELVYSSYDIFVLSSTGIG